MQGSRMRMDSYVFIYHEGKWLWMGNQGGLGEVDLEFFATLVRQ